MASAKPGKGVEGIVDDILKEESRNTKQFRETLEFLTGKGLGSKELVDESINALRKAYADLKQLQEEMEKNFSTAEQEFKKFSESQRVTLTDEGLKNFRIKYEKQEGFGKERIEKIDKQKQVLHEAHNALGDLAEACNKLISKEEAPADTKIKKFLQRCTISGDAAIRNQVERIDIEMRKIHRTGNDNRERYQKVADWFAGLINSIARKISSAAVKIKAYIQDTKYAKAEGMTVGYREQVNRDIKEGLAKAKHYVGKKIDQHLDQRAGKLAASKLEPLTSVDPTEALIMKGLNSKGRRATTKMKFDTNKFPSLSEEVVEEANKRTPRKNK